MESVVLLTKSIGIVTPLVPSIVVVVAPRLISYRITETRSYRTHDGCHQHEIVSYHTWLPDRIVQGFGDGKRRRNKRRQSNVSARWMKSDRNKICRLLGITQNISTAYHPQTDGQSERTNQWIEQYLRFWVNHQQDNWNHYLPLAEFAHNSWPNETTKQTPFEALMGYTPRAEIFDVTTSIPTVALWVDIWKKARRIADEMIIKAQCSGWLRLRMPGQSQKKVSERRWYLPSTTRRQVTRNASNNSGDGALTMVPLCRGLSGTRFTLGRRWKSRGQVGQTMDITGSLIYYWYLLDDSS